MAAYLVKDTVDNKRFVVEAGSASAAESRLSAGRYQTMTINSPADAARVVASGAVYIGADDVWPPVAEKGDGDDGNALDPDAGEEGDKKSGQAATS